jgi:hypothetical protein
MTRQTGGGKAADPGSYYTDAELLEERRACRAAAAKQRADAERLLREAAEQCPDLLRQVIDRVYGEVVDERCRRVVAAELPAALDVLKGGAD